MDSLETSSLKVVLKVIHGESPSLSQEETWNSSPWKVVVLCKRRLLFDAVTWFNLLDLYAATDFQCS